MSKVRTRIAPSPTGDPHVGTAYIALFNRCFAHSQGGQFILRIEDTDKQRSTDKSAKDILAALNWLGLSWDEGPDKGGDCGPYRQSERTGIYTEHIDRLLKEGTAFRCFCSSGQLSELRQRQMQDKAQVGYDGQCLELSEQEIADKLADGQEFVIRMKVPRDGECEFDDLLRGKVMIRWSQVDMQVLIKSDGLPTYHFANVVDDHLMEISHVIRGEEWINSTPKHLLLYQYFDWQVPVFCHMPLLRNPDKSKLSKRKNPTSIGYYQAMGYLPQAVLNYLGMMGWTMPTGEEKFSLQEMTDKFDIKRVSLGGPVFDTEKLDWLNGKYIREDLSSADFIEQYAQWAFTSEKMEAIVPLLQQRVERFSDVAPLGNFFFSGQLEITREAFTHKQLDEAQLLRILQFTLWQMEKLGDWQRDVIEQELHKLAGHMDIKIRDFLFPLFVSISGNAVSTSVIESISILGLDITRARLRHGIGILGGISKKQAKIMEREYRSWGG
ncbi:MAG: glutamate--tRNA ligase [Gammaproteobacteria bacterium]|jgi:glutamyl-tRNA synthetase|nr:glutamate--tRNA ligase [Gammaproteobacteria bacterium]MDP6097853.1 glutamate--tRNA ligase [Gammaproteobacteria bacterium]